MESNGLKMWNIPHQSKKLKIKLAKLIMNSKQSKIKSQNFQNGINSDLIVLLN